MNIIFIFSFLFYEAALVFGSKVENQESYKNYANIADQKHEQPDYNISNDQPMQQQQVQKFKQFELQYQIVDDTSNETINFKENTNKPISNFKKYLRFAEINGYLEKLAAKYPRRVEVKTAGISFEKRKMKLIKITNGDKRENKSVIFIDAGMHAREWLTTVTALYIINQLVENYAHNKDLLKNYDWIVLPLVNPDGYEFSQTKKRLWRKTRKPVTKKCNGTDINRNFDFHWGEGSASDSPCDTIFKGTEPFSEPETRTMRNILKYMIAGKRLKFYLTLHAFGRLLLYPWSWTNKLPKSWRNIDEVAKAGAAAIYAATRTEYRVGNSAALHRWASGCSSDYAFGVAKIPIVIAMELNAGGKGFNPSNKLIEPLASEAWIGIKAMAKKVMQKY